MSPSEIIDLLASFILTQFLVYLFMWLGPRTHLSTVGMALTNFGLLSSSLLSGFQLVALHYLMTNEKDILDFYQDEGSLFIIVFILCILMMSMGSIFYGLKNDSFF
jgi:hypothetical protein